tara:strand:+ start:55 stop:714 length:660 start_codon:yes stop_codon:yes gene_type:complete
MNIEFNRYKKNNDSKKAIVAIHGWGGNRDSFLPFVRNLKIDDVEWFLPEAPYLMSEAPPIQSPEVSINKNLIQKSWTYKKEDGTWEVHEPMMLLDLFFNKIIFNEYKSKDVYVMGFSQGAAVCYEYIMGMDRQLGGIFPIGGFFFKYSRKNKRVSESNKNTPIIIGHGIKDEIIPVNKSEEAFDKLSREGANVDIYKYNGGHKISMNFLRRIIEVIDGK